MKKIISLLAVLALMLTIFGGCVKKTVTDDKQDDNQDNNQTQVEENNVTDDLEDDDTDIGEDDTYDYDYGLAKDTPSYSYNAYIEAKSVATEKIYTKLEDNDEAWTVSLAMLPITMVDLYLIPITAFSGEDPAAVEMALSFFSYSDIDYSVSGDTYTLSYTDGEGAKVVQTCKYDKSADSISSTITDDNGNMSMFFEYVKTDSGYAAQYYFVDEETSEYTLITSYFDDNIVAYGMTTVASEPSSIFGKSGLGADIIEGSDSTIVLEGDTLTVVEEGTETVY